MLRVVNYGFILIFVEINIHLKSYCTENEKMAY